MYNNRIALGIDDLTRADLALRGAAGKRLTYETTRGARASERAAVLKLSRPLPTPKLRVDEILVSAPEALFESFQTVDPVRVEADQTERG
jgi:hypothetical protein